MLSINELTYYIGSRPIYKNASLHIKNKEKIGLIGLNGTGKSTLLKIINNDIKPENGTINKNSDCTIGFLNQDLLSFQSNESIKKVAMQAFSDLLSIQLDIDKVADDMEKNYSNKLLEKLSSLQEEFENKGGYKIETKTEKILEGMGFSKIDLDRSLSSFSGGWRMRVMFAKLLLEQHSLIMLDEPTNHLDLVSIQWTENYLKNYDGSVIIVSHDRTFLDNITNRTIEVCSQTLTSYPGNYSFYEDEKAIRSELQDKQFENQQKEIKNLEKFIQRFGAKASKASQAKSKEKTLEKIDRVEKSSKASATVRFKFPLAQQPGKIVSVIKNTNKAFGENQILKNASAQINRGDKIALIGPNGKGKSTVLRIIANYEKNDNNNVELGHNVIMSFFAQHQLDALNKENTILHELQAANPEKPESEIRKVAGMFLFVKDDVHKKIAILSGGEKSRVALAKVLLNQANFLLLDEPTNHLDMISVDILAQALQKYEGTFAVVSHDRHFLSKVANKIWYIENMQIKEFLGTYDEFIYYQKKSK